MKIKARRIQTRRHIFFSVSVFTGRAYPWWWDPLKPPETSKKTQDVLLFPAGVNGFLTVCHAAG